MNRSTKVLFVVAALATTLVAGDAFAQAASATATVRVQAAVVGQFVLTVDGGTTGQDFNFGSVDATGTEPGAPPRATLKSTDPSAGTATYQALSAFNWNIRSAPSRTVAITSTASKTSGSMTLNQLSMKWNRTSSNTSGTLTSTMTPIAPANTWLTAATVGNGSAVQAGTMDMELVVDSTDTAEANMWTIVFTANGV